VSQSNSFDIVSKVNLQEVANAVQNVTREITNRFDFRGSVSNVKLDKDHLVLHSDDTEKLKQLADVVKGKLVDRKVPLRALQWGKVEDATKNTVKQTVTLQSGIPIEKAREIVKLIKNTKLRVQASIQEDQVRVQGKSKDDLQAVIAMLKAQDLQLDMQFVNFR
jgi:uncharacterized protein YajQ (UPF0234 family)